MKRRSAPFHRARAALLAGCLATVLAPAEEAGPPTGDPWMGREQLHAVLWMQTSAEYRALAEQTYRAAAMRLQLVDASGTAALEQQHLPAQALAHLPTAVVLDVDETVLDNSWFQAGLTARREAFSSEAWDRWVREAAATAVPGAREFVNEAVRLGHRIFYVTNRECPLEPPAGEDACPQQTATMRNLARLGFPGSTDETNFLLRNERPEWRGSSKVERRRSIAQSHRIVALVGDDLRDFVEREVYEARREELAGFFGTRWFLLPNAMYGSWERALSDPACPPGTPRERCPGLQLSRKYAQLDTSPPPIELPGLAAWSGDRLRLATWNLDWLIHPAVFAALATNCLPKGERAESGTRRLPCDVAARGPRSEADFEAFRRSAASLAGDVVALQEVDGPAAAALVFPGYEFCFSGGAHLQNTGFAIRRGLPHRCEPDYLPLALGDEVRRGAVVTLFPGTSEEIALLGVHLKSGCHAAPLSDGTEACALLARQVEPLEQWIDAQARAGRRFAVLGDFNRRFALERGPAREPDGRPRMMLAELDDGEPAGADLLDVTRGKRFRKCRADEPYTSYIDTVLLGESLARERVRSSFIRLSYYSVDMDDRRLSDHCPVGIELRVQ